jgi:predicted methyltransferase
MKRQSLIVTALAALFAAGGVSACATMGGEQGFSAADRTALASAIASPTRTPANVLRDRYRHPAETLAFFGVRPTDTVVEIWPGGGWYTEILAPYLRAGGGTYIAAAPPAGISRLATWRDTNVATVGQFPIRAFPTFEPAHQGVAPGSADVVLTFRNVHNWRIGSGRDNQDYSVEAFRQLYAMLKPGGTLGIVDHRLPESANAERERTSGYMKVSTVRQLSEQAGFRLDASSEVNANPRDTADWPDGVWTLPPTLRRGEADRERYLAIGESDRMTLRFVKPR